MSKEFFGVQIDTSNMTTEELTEARKEISVLLAQFEHELLMRKMAERRHSSECSKNC